MDVREEFLKFFESKAHERRASAPLVPDDATLLFNNAGMVPFKSIFTGEVPSPTNPRITSCQTCVRAGGKHNDLENVGYTARHHTLFEMLGNFSFGDYFKEDAIAYAWEFITCVLEFDIEKLWVTIHISDDEAFEIWSKHIAKERIVRLGDEDNFWQMGESGPCGPCSEIFVDQGADRFNSSEDRLGGDGDRFLEIWNLVFMQYERDKTGTLTPLPEPSIDTGMGLERVVALLEGKQSNYDSSLFMPIINKISTLIDKGYTYESGASFRVIADHIRTVTFLLSQGVTFSNEGRGYVLRRILRRAVRHGYLLGFSEPFMFLLVESVAEILAQEYGYLNDKLSYVQEQTRLEEKRFFKTIADGIELFNKELKRSADTFSASVAFRLYDTYGFPLDLTQDMLKERDIKLDINEFNLLMSAQKERAKSAWRGSGDDLQSGDFKELLEKFGRSKFVGYDKTRDTNKILALLSDSFKKEDQLHMDQTGWVLLDRSVFYAQGGGQCGDSGELSGVADILDTREFFGLILSHVRAKSTINIGDTVESIVSDTRAQIEAHHSATHLLHSALYKELGEHVSQAGSLVESSRLRFDFSHPSPLTYHELRAVEERVNSTILASITTEIEQMDIERAKESGAKAQFGEKYGDEVRVVSFGDESIEFCGGTHVSNSAQIGLFIITKESGVSAGVRRIEALCSKAAYNYFKQQRHSIEQACKMVKNQDLIAGITRLTEQQQELKQELKEARKSFKQELVSKEIANVAVTISRVDGVDIKQIVDEVKNSHESVAVMLFEVKGDKVIIAAGVKNAPVKAGAWIRQIAPILGGGGGGRDDFAQAGGKDASKIDEAIDASWQFITEALC